MAVSIGRPARSSMPDLAVDLARSVVFAEVIVGDHQVQLRLGVVRVQADGFFEVALGLCEVALGVRNHSEHVENICETIRLRHHLPQQILGLVELALLVVLPAQKEKLLDVIVHAPCMEAQKPLE